MTFKVTLKRKLKFQETKFQMKMLNRKKKNKNTVKSLNTKY